MWKIFYILCLVKACSSFYSKSSSVVELTSANFDRLVINSNEIWLVEFFVPWCGHCQQLAHEYLKAANSLKGVVKVGALNGEEESSVCARFDVKGYPTIKIFGVDKYKPLDYSSQRNSHGLVEAAISALRNKVFVDLDRNIDLQVGSFYNFDSENVMQLTNENFDILVLRSDKFWLVEFYSPQCQYCKTLAPIWAEAATELKGKMNLGALDATAYKLTANNYNIKAYPTIKCFQPDKTIVEYKGGRTTSDIVEWATDKYMDSLPPQQVTQITDFEEFGTTCIKKPLCVIAFLPHIMECGAHCRNDYLAILTIMAEKYKRTLWGWTWCEAIQQSNLEDSLDIGGFGYPAMAVVNFKKMKFSLLRGAFSKEGIDEFLSNISYGKGRTSTVKDARLPKIIASTPWDGNDIENPFDEDIKINELEKDEL